MDFFWTQHALYKLKQYGLSEQRVKRVIRAPFRVEEGIVPKTIAVMVPAGNFKMPKKGEKPAWKQEIWAMYIVPRDKKQGAGDKEKGNSKNIELQKSNALKARKIKIISAWRYPGVSPENDPIPESILRELRAAVN